MIQPVCHDDNDHSDMMAEHEHLHKESATAGSTSYPKGTSDNDFKTLSDMISSLQSAFDKH